MIVLLVAALAWLPASAPAETVRSALERLEHPASSERRAAERWLALNLDPGDLATLAEAAPGLGFEARARLAAAIGSDERHFALATLLATEPPVRAEGSTGQGPRANGPGMRGSGMRGLGEEALQRMIERWWGSSELEPERLPSVVRALEGNFADRMMALELGRQTFAEELDSVVRHLGIPEGLPMAGPVPVVLDPALYAVSLRSDRRRESPAESEVVSMSPEQMLLTVIDRQGEATMQGFAMDGSRTWFHVVHRGSAGQKSGAALVLEWCRTVIESKDDALAEGAARALAATAWPGALDWLAWRWNELSDRRALSGLLLAAERGRVVSSLARSASVVQLLAAADESILRGRPLDLRFAEEVLRAIGAMGGLGDGGDLAELVAESFDELPVASQRLRLGVLGSLGRIPEGLAGGLRRRLADPQGALPPELSRDMVRALALGSLERGGEASFVWSDPLPMFQREVRPSMFWVMDRWLAASGARPPDAWRDPAAIGVESKAAIRRARIITWWLQGAGGLEPAADHLNYLVAQLTGGGQQEANAGDVLARYARRGRRASVVELIERAREQGGDAARLERMALLAGVLDPESMRAQLARLQAAAASAGGKLPEADLQLLGVLAGEPESDLGGGARELFLGHLTLAMAASPDRRDAPWAPALERALTSLRGAQVPRGLKQRAEEEFLLGLRGELRESKHPAAIGIRSGQWPRHQGLAPELLEAKEVRLTN